MPRVVHKRYYTIRKRKIFTDILGNFQKFELFVTLHVDSNGSGIVCKRKNPYRGASSSSNRLPPEKLFVFESSNENEQGTQFELQHETIAVIDEAGNLESFEDKYARGTTNAQGEVSIENEEEAEDHTDDFYCDTEYYSFKSSEDDEEWANDVAEEVVT